MTARYSVIIPTYNRRETLLVVLRALLAQDAPKLLGELIVVDDGSTDGTADVVRGFDTQFPLTLLEGRRGGPAAARNAGVAAASCERVLFLCDDIEATPSLLRGHEQRRAGVTDAHAVVGRVRWPPGKRVTAFERFVMERYHFGYDALEGLDELPFHAFITANLSIDRALLLELGGFDEDFSYGWEDTDLGLRATEAGVRLLYAPDAIGYHHHTIEPVSYCRRQEAVGRSAAHFIARHPTRGEVVGAHRLPRRWSARWLLKGALFNRWMLSGWRAIAGGLAGLGAARAARLVWSQVLAACYYRGMAQALTGH